MKKVIIIGGGATGCEVALDLSEKGCDIAIVEQLPEIGTQIEAMTRKIIFKKFKERGVKIMTGFQLIRISVRGAYLLDNEGKELLLEGDSIIIAVGNRPDNSLFNQVKDLGIEAYQVGDCLEVRSAKEAIFEGASIGRLI